ncbi:hypothetical protein B0H11DRAFT_2223769 [Mycena galericulata]|nr:hypothetical protein B0H11DRAFT_2223769 [Mycena galericulata]
MAQISLHTLQSTAFQDLVFVTTDNCANDRSMHTSTRFVPRPIPACRWHSMSAYLPTLVPLIDLAMLVEPALLDDLAFWKLGKYSTVLSRDKIWAVEELMVSLRRRLFHMATVEAAAIATYMRVCGGSIRGTRNLHATCAGWDEDNGGWDSDELPELIE